MKILYLASLESIHSRRWIQFFADRGHEVHAISKPSEDSGELRNVSVHYTREHNIDFEGSVFSNLIQSVSIVLRFRKILKEVQPDLIHIHQIGFLGYLLCLVSKSFPKFVTAWGSDVLVMPKRSALHKHIVSKVLKEADAVSSDAEHMKTAMMEFGLVESKHNLIYFGTDCVKFNPDKKDDNLKQELGFPSDSKMVISLRALNPIYNIETVVRAVPLVLEKVKNVRFIVVGGGSEKEMLMELAKTLGVEDYILFAGRLPFSDLVRYTASADVYISSSLSDAGLAASTAEAMACRVPVVVTDFGDNKDWVADGESGFLFPLKDFQTLGDKLIEILSNDGLANKLAENGRSVIFERNNVEKEMLKIEKLYEKTQRESNQAP